MHLQKPLNFEQKVRCVRNADQHTVSQNNSLILQDIFKQTKNNAGCYADAQLDERLVLIVAAYALLISPSIAERTKRVSIPSVCQIQPPKMAMKMLIRWFTETPVEIVALVSSGESERSLT